MPGTRAEEMLRVTRALVDRVPSMLAYFDATLTCLFANRAYAARLGLEAEGVAGMTMMEILGPQRFAVRSPYIRRALEGQEQAFEDVERQADGGRRYLMINYVPEKDADRVIGLAVEITDISALRYVELALRDSEAKFRTLSESSPLGVFLADVHGKRTYTNARWQQIYGLPAGAGLGDGWMRTLHEDDRDRVVAAWRSMAGQARELELEFRIRAPGAAVRHVRTHTRPIRNDADELVGFVGALEDITARKADEDRLRASEEFLDRTGAIAGVGGWELDLRTGRVVWSAHTRRIHEVDDDFEPSLGRGREFYPPEALAVLDPAIQRAIEHGEPWDLELPFITARGRALWVRTFGVADREDGVTVRLSGAFQDITDYRRNRLELSHEKSLRQDVEEHAAELARLLQERGEMLDVMAHEVRQPLNNASAALQGASEVVEELHDMTASSRLLRAQTVLGQVLSSIDNTLAVASLLARPDPVRLVDTDIDTTLAVAIGDLLPAEKARIAIVRDTRTRTATMDMSLMRLAMRNLLSNALRYGHPERPVVIRVGDWDDPLALVIEVSNEGSPVSPEQVARLFERAAPRTPGDMAPAQGLGLGLYIVRRVMELHSGRVELAVNEPDCVAFRLVLLPQLGD